MSVVIETTLGDITVDLYLEQRPVTCLNFLKLCKMKYYNFNLFHSIRSGFIAQTGDPTAEGSGGESIFGLLEGPEKRFFSGEKLPKIRHTNTGTLSMVCTGDMMVGSQFFFTLAPDLDSLDSMHCVIGEVTEGHDVLRMLNDVICDESHRPYRDVRVTHTVVLEDPFNDPPGLRAPSRSPSPSAERLKGGRIAPDEDIDEAQGKSSQEIQEIIEEKEAKARATILEIVGDLPDAEIAPPENVLFVCKLNPVTTDEDLEIIFSRFGKIVGCEVIRDKKTGDSLQYAFIEFDDKKSCEDAYFKMDNVLIDDRRIHVDFSQSVSRMRWMGKGKGIKYFNNNEPKEEYGKDNSSRKTHNQDKDRGDHNNGRIEDNNQRRRGSRDRADKKDKDNKYERSDRHDRHKKSERDRYRRERSRSRTGTDRHRSRRDRSIERSSKEKSKRTEKTERERSRKDRSRSRDKSRHHKDKSESRSGRNRSRKDSTRSRDDLKHREDKDERHRSRKDRSRSKEKSRHHDNKNESLTDRDRSRKDKDKTRNRTSHQDAKNESLAERDRSRKDRSQSKDKSRSQEDKTGMVTERGRSKKDITSGDESRNHEHKSDISIENDTSIKDRSRSRDKSKQHDENLRQIRKSPSQNVDGSKDGSSSESMKNQLEDESRNCMDMTNSTAHSSRELEMSQDKTSEEYKNYFTNSYWTQIQPSESTRNESERSKIQFKTSKLKDVSSSNKTRRSQSNDRYHKSLEKDQTNDKEAINKSEKQDTKSRYGNSDSGTNTQTHGRAQNSDSRNKSSQKYSDIDHSDNEANQYPKQDHKKTDDRKSNKDNHKQKHDEQSQSSLVDRKSDHSNREKSVKNRKEKDPRTPTPVDKKGRTTKKIGDNKKNSKVLKKKRKHSSSSDSSSESTSSSESSSSEDERKKKSAKLRKRKVSSSSSSSSTSSSSSSSSSSESSSTSSSSDSEPSKKKRKKNACTKVTKSKTTKKKL